MITDFLYSINVNEVWFQQHCATCHTFHATIELLCQTFDAMVMSLGRQESAIGDRWFNLTRNNYDQ